MYRIHIGGELFYDPRDKSLSLADVEVRQSVDEADSMTFSVPSDHPRRDLLRVMGRLSEVVLTDGDTEVFRGRVTKTVTDGYGSTEVECEGMRAYLNDATVGPHTTDSDDEDFDGAYVEPSVSSLFRYYLSEYNSRVPYSQQVFEGRNMGDVLSGGKTVSVSETTRKGAWELIKANIVEPYDAAVRIRRAGGNMVADLVAVGSSATSQRVEHGSNVVSVSVSVDGTEVATRIVATGKDSDGNVVGITGVPDMSYGGFRKRGEMVVNETAELEYGVIERAVQYDEPDPYEVVALARKELEAAAPKRTVDVNVVDLSVVVDGVQPILANDTAHFVCERLGIDDWVACRERTIHPLSPNADTVSLGSAGNTITGDGR